MIPQRKKKQKESKKVVLEKETVDERAIRRMINRMFRGGEIQRKGGTHGRERPLPIAASCSPAQLACLKTFFLIFKYIFDTHTHTHELHLISVYLVNEKKKERKQRKTKEKEEEGTRTGGRCV